MKKDIIRVGDLVKITNPHFFVRCGYPFDIEYAKEHLISQEEKNTLNEMFNGISFDKGAIGNFGGYHYNKALHLLAHRRLQEHGFGGNERTIHTKHLPEKEGLIFRVVDRHTFITGKYVPSHTSSYDGGFDPAGLCDRKVNLVFEVAEKTKSPYHIFDDTLWIQKKNCVKVCD